MTRYTIVLTVFLIAASAAPPEGGDDATPVSPYKHRAVVACEESGASLYALDLPAEVLGSSAKRCADIRLIDAAENEIPFHIRVLGGEKREQRITGRELNRARKVGYYSELTVELEPPELKVNGVEIDTLSRDFRYLVTIEGSDDGEVWLLIIDQVSIFDFTEDVRLRRTDVEFPLSRYAYFRIRVFDGAGEPFEFDEVGFSYTTESPVELVEVEATIGPWQEISAEHLSLVDATLDAGSLPLTSLQIDTATERFQRRFRLQAPGAIPGQGGTVYSRGEFHRYVSAEVESEQLAADLTGEWVPAEFEAVIENEDNPPLTDVHLRFFMQRHRLYYPGGWTPPLRLYIGDTQAKQPGYEFAQLFKFEDLTQAVEAQLGVLEENPDYVAFVPPLKERLAANPWLLYGAYAVAVVVVLLLLYQAMRKRPSSDDGTGGLTEN